MLLKERTLRIGAYLIFFIHNYYIVTESDLNEEIGLNERI